MPQAIGSFWYGLTLPLRAAALIARSPALLGASILPCALSAAINIWLVHKLQLLLAGWIHAHATGAWETAGLVLSWIAVFVLGFLTFSFVASIAALPFSDWLAELTEGRATPPLERVGGISWTGRARLLTIDLFKTVCAMGMSLVALVLSWIPVINFLALGLAFMLIAFQFLSYPQTRRGEGVFGGAAFLARHFWSSLGFGMSFAGLFAVPLVSTLSLPIAVVGGTLLYARGTALDRARSLAPAAGAI